MKKLILLLVAIILVGCNAEAEEQIHEDVSQEMVDETKEVVEIIELVVEEDREYTSEEEIAIDEYSQTYGNVENVTPTESKLHLFVDDVLRRTEQFKDNPESLENYTTMIDNIIRTGDASGSEEE